MMKKTRTYGKKDPLKGYRATPETLRGILKDSFSNPKLKEMFEGFTWDPDPEDEG